MSILFIGKRFYTNRDAYTERFGRIYQLPYHWSKETKINLWLIDYHSREKINTIHADLNITATPILSILFLLNTFKSIFLIRPKMIVASGDCYIGLFSFILAKLCKAKFIFDVYDKYDTFSGYKNLGFKNLFHFLLKKADTCMFASKKFKDDCEQICKKTILAPNGINTSQFYPRNKFISRKYFNLNNNNFYLGYFGSMEEERGIDDLINTVIHLRKSNDNVYILLGGKKREDLNIDKKIIHYLGNLNYKDVPIAMACCDVLTLPYRDSEFLNNASSCKINEYLAMQIPILATKNQGIMQNFNHSSIMYVSLNSDIEFLLHKLKNIQDYGKNTCINDDISWESIANKIISHMNSSADI